MVSKIPLESGLQEEPLKQFTKPQMPAPDTETQDQQPMTIIMESMETDVGEIETMEPDKKEDNLKIPTVPRNKRFKPALTSQNSKPTSGIPIPKNLTNDFTTHSTQ
ncbi:hypothetical protein GHT06_015211 [Daphnia sinensis]|uniref:Uncharacterized protein n=1 Tax=Daphnia sinensis TaxID=1820382 RepID=A0AAD5KSZ1_9CRUS|nr:hypothetical protein GHT06_015211 [Daphnia sinensis]